MKLLQVFAFLLLAFGGIAYAGYKTKCDVVRSLRSRGVPDSEMRDWLCLVQHESNYRYDAKHGNCDGSTDYGIYQINSRYWCDRGMTKYTQCWQINTYGCGIPCSSLMKADIADATECAVKIKRCGRDGFGMWVAWRKFCQGKNLAANPEYDFHHCWNTFETTGKSQRFCL